MVRDLSKLERFTRGGEVERHKLNMLLANITALGTAAGIAGVAGSGIAAKLASGAAWPLYWRYNLARLADTVGLGDMSLLAIQNYTPAAFVQTFGKAYHAEFLLTTPVAALSGVGLAGAVLAFAYLRFLKRDATFKDKHLRGKKVLSQQELIEFMREHNAKTLSSFENVPPEQRPGQYVFCGVPLPAGMLQRNVLATGGMGSGKSVALFLLVDQLAKYGRSLVIYDKVGEFTAQYYRGEDSGDVILNPFDARFPKGWNIFNEIKDIPDFDMLATYFIPKKDGADDTGAYFKSTARTVFSAILQKLWDEGLTEPSKRTNESVCHAIYEMGQDKLYEWLRGTPAEPLLNPDSKGSGGGGMLTTLGDAVYVLKYIKSGPFCMREFVSEEARRPGHGRRLFVNSTEDFAEILKPFTSLMMSLAYKNWMKQDLVRYERVGFVIDEMASLGSLNVLKNAVTEARKFGVATIIGAQNVAQFDEMFGKDAAKTIRSNLQNYILLRVADEETAESYSKQIGVEELDEQSDGISFGSAEQRDSGSINTQRKERRLVLASEIQTLPDMSGFLQLAGEIPIARVAYSWKDREPRPEGWQPAGGFVKRDLALGSAPITPARASDNPEHSAEDPRGYSAVPRKSARAALGLD